MRRPIFCATAFVTIACILAPATLADSLPAGSVAFFNAAQCPDGWAALPAAEGRLIASLPPSGSNGAKVGDPLANQEDRQHDHSYDFTLTTASVSYVLIGGCCNESLAASKTYAFQYDTGGSSSGLPYVQLLVCKKSDGPSGGDPEVPKNLLTYSSKGSCPQGFSQPLTLQGRFFVGLPEGGAPGASFGGPSLDPQKAPNHDHPYTGNVALRPAGILGSSGCCADGYAKAQTYGYNGTTDEASVGLPFIQYLNCMKD